VEQKTSPGRTGLLQLSQARRSPVGIVRVASARRDDPVSALRVWSRVPHQLQNASSSKTPRLHEVQEAVRSILDAPSSPVPAGTLALPDTQASPVAVGRRITIGVAVGDGQRCRFQEPGARAWAARYYVGEPECNGVAERFIRTLEEECLYPHDLESLKTRGRSSAFIERCNREWILERHGYVTPTQARQELTRMAA
jgi:hypothetical protein